MKQIDHGVVLHRINYSETSLILSIYTRDAGIRKFIFQGGKKKASVLFPMSSIELTFYKRPDSELAKLTAVVMNEGCSEIPFHPLRSTLAFFIADVLRHCLKAEQKDQELYAFITRSIEQLNTTNEFAFFPLHFLIELIDQLGISPNFESDTAEVFVLDEGEFRNNAFMAKHVEQGQHVVFLNALFNDKPTEGVSRSVRLDALHTLLKYFQFHIPGFNVDRSLSVLQEVLT